MGSGEMNAWQLMIKGGPIMWPLFLCSLAALTLFIEKLFYFSSIATNTTELKRKIFDCVKENKIREAVLICEQSHSPVAKMIKAGLVQSGGDRSQIKAALEEAGEFEVPLLEKRLNTMASIAHASLLLGFLGTVVGMAQIFYAIEVRSVSMNPVTVGDLAGGVWQALLTTIFGLCVAIPTFLAYQYCLNCANDYVVKMEKAAVELVQVLSYVSTVPVNSAE